MGRWRERARGLKRLAWALAIAARDPRTPWYARAVAVAVVAYALSPIDLIPDVIPVLGLLDDLVLVPLGVWLAVRLIPPAAWVDARAAAATADRTDRPGDRVAAAVIVALWVASLVAVALLARRLW